MNQTEIICGFFRKRPQARWLSPAGRGTPPLGWDGKILRISLPQVGVPLNSALGASCKEKEVICIARLIALGFSI